MSPKTNPASLPPPWGEFLERVDASLPGAVELHCLGGFVVTVLFGAPRTTGDLDYVSIVPSERSGALEEIGGQDSALAQRFRVYIQRVGVADYPEDYAQRLTEMLPGRFRNLRLLALDPYDIVLSKLTSNRGVDREDLTCRMRPATTSP